MRIDCDSCVARGPGCTDCVVALLLGAPGSQGRPSDTFRADFDEAEADALAVLAGSGLVPPVRMTGTGGATREAGRLREADRAREARRAQRRAAGGRATGGRAADGPRAVG